MGGLKTIPGRGGSRGKEMNTTQHMKLENGSCMLLAHWLVRGVTCWERWNYYYPPISLWDVQNALLPLPSSSGILLLFMGQFRCFLGNCPFFIFVSLHEVYIMHSL